MQDVAMMPAGPASSGMNYRAPDGFARAHRGPCARDAGMVITPSDVAPNQVNSKASACAKVDDRPCCVTASAAAIRKQLRSQSAAAAMQERSRAVTERSRGWGPSRLAPKPRCEDQGISCRPCAVRHREPQDRSGRPRQPVEWQFRASCSWT
jgi:hypothetical protein